MAEWIDFKVLRSKLSFQEVLAHYRVNLKTKGDQAMGICALPGHKGEKRAPSFSANLARGIWQCFGCGAKGNVLDFAIHMEGLSPEQSADVRTVALRLRDQFQIEGVTRNRNGSGSQQGSAAKKDRTDDQLTLGPHPGIGSIPTTADVRINEPLDFELKGLQADHPYLTGRGLLAETIRHFGLGYCGRGFLAGRVAIPLHDPPGRLVGYAGRVIDDHTMSDSNPKYRFPERRERKGVVHDFDRARLLYNAHRIKTAVDSLIVVAGFASVWWLHQADLPNAVALMGYSCSPEQATVLRAKTTARGRVTVFSANDESGDRCVQSVFAELGEHRWIRWISVPEGRCPTAFPPDELVQYLRA